MEYNRLLEIVVGITEVCTKIMGPDDRFWEKIKDLNMTTWEIQEIGLKRYEVFSYSSNPKSEIEDVITIWDNVLGSSIPELYFESEEAAMEKIKILVENDLEQEGKVLFK